MFLLQQILPAVLVAGLISGVFAIAGRLWRANNWADAVALGVGYAGGHVATAGWPAFPPAEATQWLPYFALAAMFLGVIDALLRPAGSLRVLIWILCCMGFLRLLLNAKFQYGWSLAQGVLWIVGLAAGMLMLAISLDAAVRRDRSISIPLILTSWPVAQAPHSCSRAACFWDTRDGSCGRSRSNSCGGFPAPKGRRRTRRCSCRGGAACQSLAQRLFLLGASLGQCTAACRRIFPGSLMISLSERLSSWRAVLMRAGIVIIPVAISVLLAFLASPSPRLLDTH